MRKNNFIVIKYLLMLFLLLLTFGCVQNFAPLNSETNEIQFKFSPISGVVSCYVFFPNTQSRIVVDCHWYQDGGNWTLKLRKFVTDSSESQKTFIKALLQIIPYVEKYLFIHSMKKGVISSIELSTEDFDIFFDEKKITPESTWNDIQNAGNSMFPLDSLISQLWSQGFMFQKPLFFYKAEPTPHFEISINRFDLEDLTIY